MNTVSIRSTVGAARQSFLLLPVCAVLFLPWSATAADFIRLVPLPALRITASAEEYPGGNHRVANLTDTNVRSEYSSNGKGKDTYVEFDLDSPVPVAAFRHVDRNDPATISTSRLTFFDAAGQIAGEQAVTHANERGGVTFAALAKPVTAQRVRWQVTGLGPQNFGTVGGAEIAFFRAGETESVPRGITIEARVKQLAERTDAGLRQPVQVTLNHPYTQPVPAVLNVTGAEPRSLTLKPGAQTIKVSLPEAKSEQPVRITVEALGQVVATQDLVQKPVRQLTVYILPHSHTDIGYTEIQTDIEKRQVQNLVDGIAHAERTKDYPEGSRFIWNVEVLWAADLYLRRLDDQQRARFFDAVKRGQVALCGMYLNELTGLCRPEELVRLFRYATKLSEQTGQPIESVMISDVPGYTWGTVTAMAHAGIKYFSTAPNYFDRIGTILREWENKPFWWVGPDGRTKVLTWIPFWGYAMSHRYGKMSPQLVDDFYEGLEKREYPYDIAHVRWAGHGDNAIPDPAICDFVRDWNAKYAWPKFIISGANEAFRALEKRYGDQLPRVRGDWTPYWEDGAGSSALETAMNRQSSDRMTQAEALFAMSNPKAYPAAAFEDAWNRVLLYSEHTWGAWCSVNEPERKETREQWEIKRGYAEAADRQSRELLAKATFTTTGDRSGAKPGALDVFNTMSWERTELVTVPAAHSAIGDRVTDARGKVVPSQRLRSGELVFLASKVPPLAAKRFVISAGTAPDRGTATAIGAILDSGRVRIRVDEATGGIAELTTRGLEGNFADTSGGETLNDYRYLIGDDLRNVQRNGAVRISVGEPGPLVASLVIESDAPGCKTLRREVRVVSEQEHVELINQVDKARLAGRSYMAKEGKESLNFAFPFNVPDGDLLLDLPLGTMRAEDDQMPSACKNWFTVGRWANVWNRERGITWVTLDAPLVQVGGLTATLLNSQTNPDVWRKKVDRTQRLYSWAMNNHWGTNYRAYQEGLTVFRFILRPFRKHDPAEASRFATGFSQPLLPVPASGKQSTGDPLFKTTPASVLVTGLKPSDDGTAWIIRLFGAAKHDESVELRWGRRAPRLVFLSDTSETRGRQVTGTLKVPSQGLVTLRAEW
jgi:alpha-mannosidase